MQQLLFISLLPKPLIKYKRESSAFQNIFHSNFWESQATFLQMSDIPAILSTHQSKRCSSIQIGVWILPYICLCSNLTKIIYVFFPSIDKYLPSIVSSKSNLKNINILRLSLNWIFFSISDLKNLTLKKIFLQRTKIQAC